MASSHQEKGRLSSLPLIIVGIATLTLTGCRPCQTGAECAANSRRWEDTGVKIANLGEDVFETGGKLAGYSLRILGEGVRIGGEWGGKRVRRLGEWLAEKTSPLANFPKALEMGLEAAKRK